MLAKSILETEVKRIIDPSELDLLILNNNRNDFIINLAHNYYNPYDNVRKIPEWFSNDICAATTGAGFSTRTLYTTTDETYLKFKRCFALSSIGASLTEDDALERCISIKHPKLIKQNRKLEEKILAEFDEYTAQVTWLYFRYSCKDHADKRPIVIRQTNSMESWRGWLIFPSGAKRARAMGYRTNGIFKCLW